MQRIKDSRLSEWIHFTTKLTKYCCILFDIIFFIKMYMVDRNFAEYTLEARVRVGILTAEKVAMLASKK